MLRLEVADMTGSSCPDSETRERCGTLSPRISVIVSVFNGAATLQRCIDSISNQTYREAELVVIDGGSTDGTREILESNAPELAYWESEVDRGIYHAWNKGLAHARGNWICFLGADDYLWAPDVLEQMMQTLAVAYPPLRVAYGQVVVVNQNNAELSRVGAPWPAVKDRITQIMCLPHTGLMHHRTLFEQHGTFDESFRIAGDYEMLLRELKSSDALFVPGVVVAGMQHGGMSSNPVGSLVLLREFRRAQRMHGFTKPGMHWISAFAKAHLRVWLWKFLGARVASRVFDFGRLLSGKRAYWTRQ